MNIVALVTPNNGVDYHRLLLPFHYMPWKEGDSVMVLQNDKSFNSDMLARADIVTYCRTCPFNLDKILDARNKYGFKLVIDIDDFWFLYENHHLINTWLRDETSKKMIRSIEIADFIFCTNNKLKSRIEMINENVAIIKNAFPYGEGQFVKNEPYEYGLIRFIYAGGITHLQDIKTIAPALGACSQNLFIANNAVLQIAGYSNSRTWNRIIDVAKMFGSYGTIPALPLNNYMDCYNSADVCIAPLASNDFNTYKSTLKTVEAGCKGMPLICSDMLPYNEDNLCDGIVFCKNSKDWYNAIDDFVKRPHKIKEKGDILHKHVFRHYNLHTENRKRYHLYKQTIAL